MLPPIGSQIDFPSCLGHASASEDAPSLGLGLGRSLLNNIVTGVSTGFQKVLEINGVGYRAESKGKVVNFQLGYSHPIAFPVPDGIDISVEKQTTLTIKGIDKQLVGETAAKIRALRPPEPYKGKGVKYADEHIRRKAGKANV